MTVKDILNVWVNDSDLEEDITYIYYDKYHKPYELEQVTYNTTDEIGYAEKDTWIEDELGDPIIKGLYIDKYDLDNYEVFQTWHNEDGSIELIIHDPIKK